MRYIAAICLLIASVTGHAQASLVPDTMRAYTVDTSMYNAGVEDADAYYTGYRLPAVATIVTTIVGTPIVGLMPAISFSLITPHVRHFKTSDPALLNNYDYIRGYAHEARKIKAAAVWAGYADVSVYYLDVVCFAFGNRGGHGGHTHYSRR